MVCPRDDADAQIIKTDLRPDGDKAPRWGADVAALMIIYCSLFLVATGSSCSRGYDTVPM